MTTAVRALLHADLSPCYLGCDVQTTGMAWAALSLDDGAVVGSGLFVNRIPADDGYICPECFVCDDCGVYYDDCECNG